MFVLLPSPPKSGAPHSEVFGADPPRYDGTSVCAHLDKRVGQSFCMHGFSMPMKKRAEIIKVTLRTG